MKKFKFSDLIPKKRFKSFKYKPTEEDIECSIKMQSLMDNANFHSARCIEHLSNILN